MAGEGYLLEGSTCNSRIRLPAKPPERACLRTSPASIAPVSGLLLSLHCKPIDYYLRVAVEKDTSCSVCNTKMVAKIEKELEDFPRATVRNICARFRNCLEAAVEAEGDYFE